MTTAVDVNVSLHAAPDLLHESRVTAELGL